MIQIKDKKNCCGCNSCVQACPKQCITMAEDEEGFLYPHVDAAVCIDCGLCARSCPVINQAEPREPIRVYAATNPDEEQRLHSSSGGIFIMLAKETIKVGGVVFGAKFDKDWEVKHCYAETEEDLKPLMRSKYVQSRIENTFKEAENFLKQGRNVMFVGTPCQIAGLKKYLKKEYDNLLTVDIICHGVPSPKVWREYLEELRNNTALKCGNGNNSESSSSKKDSSIITSINFREKQLGGFSWKKFGFVAHGTKSGNSGERTVLASSPLDKNIYMRGFIANLFLRPSCHYCPSRSGKSGSDITLGDAWGIWNVSPELDDDKGISAVMINTEKGEIALRHTNAKISNLEYNDVLKYNSPVYKSTPIAKNRDIFWDKFNSDGIICVRRILKPTIGKIMKRIIKKLRRTIKL